MYNRQLSIDRRPIRLMLCLLIVVCVMDSSTIFRFYWIDSHGLISYDSLGFRYTWLRVILNYAFSTFSLSLIFIHFLLLLRGQKSQHCLLPVHFLLCAIPSVYFLIGNIINSIQYYASTISKLIRFIPNLVTIASCVLMLIDSLLRHRLLKVARIFIIIKFGVLCLGLYATAYTLADSNGIFKTMHYFDLFANIASMVGLFVLFQFYFLCLKPTQEEPSFCAPVSNLKGRQLGNETRYCAFCGNLLYATARFCPKCGAEKSDL